MIDQLMYGGDKLDASAIGEVATEHGVLEMIAKTAEGLIDSGTTGVVRDVVGDDEAIPHVTA